MEITKKSQWTHIAEYAMVYDWNDTPGAGFSFPCDATGKIFLNKMGEHALNNMVKCQSGEYAVTCMGVADYSRDYLEPAVGRCDCGREVHMDKRYDTECECGREYNCFGQQLAPRGQRGMY